MLSIGPIRNTYNAFLNFKAKQYPQNSPLKPMAFDSVSFSSRDLTINRELYKDLNNHKACKKVVRDAKPALKSFRDTIYSAFMPHFYTSYDNPQGVVENIKIRVKRPDSIREKVTEEIQYARNNDIEEISSPKDPEAIKGVIGDIIGARIILRKPDMNKTSKLIDTLIGLVERGEIKITNVENYEPKGLDPSLKYFSEEDLGRLQEAVEKTRKEGDAPVEFSTKQKKTGYMALHIDVDLSQKSFRRKYNGYKGEIQIMGSEVEGLKEVDDFCYKLKQKKAPRGGNPAYQELVEHFNNYMTPEFKEAYSQYATRAFIAQREKEALGTNRHKLPTLEECGMKDVLPNQLDYNEIAKLIYECDKKKMMQDLRRCEI